MADQAVQITYLVQLFTSVFSPSQYDTINQSDEVAIHTDIQGTFVSNFSIHITYTSSLSNTTINFSHKCRGGWLPRWRSQLRIRRRLWGKKWRTVASCRSGIQLWWGSPWRCDPGPFVHPTMNRSQMSPQRQTALRRVGCTPPAKPAVIYVSLVVIIIIIAKYRVILSLKAQNYCL